MNFFVLISIDFYNRLFYLSNFFFQLSLEVA